MATVRTMAAHSAYYMFSFSHLCFKSGTFDLIVPCPDNAYFHLFVFQKNFYEG